ncbi:hypothetical protein RE6C_05467 [Rhodopirellula europaea 6C]|uniref:Uncharacterized protein n=1 Tax=Rhodopirellula europaea 6C TaxID=1263867 RepID=M2AUX6_9BACT|nr:hypothetical protein RE6C_05467 [Rhodopirellula europaea 6C]
MCTGREANELGINNERIAGLSLPGRYGLQNDRSGRIWTSAK